MYPNFSRASQENKQRSTNIKFDEIDIMNNINDNTFNLHYYNLLNNDNIHMKVTLKSKLIGVARLLISADYREF